MDCSRVGDLIPQYCNGELDDDTRRQVEKHISGCSACSDDLKREQQLRCMISKSAADDPPEGYWSDFDEKLRMRMQAVVVALLGYVPGNPTNEYWEEYDGSLRHRIRAAIGALWGIGLIQMLLAGALYAFSIAVVGGFLLNRSGLGTIRPAWLRVTLEVAILAATVVGVTVLVRSLFGLLNRTVFAPRRWMPSCERMTGPQPVAPATPFRLRIRLGLIMLGYLGLCAYIPLSFTRTLVHIPEWAVNGVTGLMYIGFAGSIPAFYTRVRASLIGTPEASNRLREWTQRYRRGIFLANMLMYLALLAILVAGIWNFAIGIAA